MATSKTHWKRRLRLRIRAKRLRNNKLDSHAKNDLKANRKPNKVEL